MTTINFSYGLTKPGDVPYSSEQFRASLETEVDEAISDMALIDLANKVKLFVINEAGLSASTDANGVISAAFVERAPTFTQSGPTPQGLAPVVPINRGAPGPDTYNPAVDGPPFDADLATVPAPAAPAAAPAGGVPNQWDGRPVSIFDNRPKKRSGEHKPTAGDFTIRFEDLGPDAPNNLKYKSIWIKNQNGSINQAGVALAAAFDGA